MLKVLFLHLLAIPVFGLQLARAIPAEGWRHALKRLLLFICIWFVFSLLNLLHILGHLADELLFSTYRHTPIKNPVFILGIPRSGTTFLQRLLSQESKFTTLSTWEAALAPSLTEKYLYRAIGWLGRPFSGLCKLVGKKLFRQMDSIHKLGLREPEEDFLLLLPILGCFLPVFLCPDSSHYWKLGNFDKSVSAGQKKVILDFYRVCLQKHLVFQGPGKRLLSKNPSFTSWSESLLSCYPDAQLIACIRSPLEAVPSQLSAMRPAMTILGNGQLSQKTRNKLIDLLYNYYFQLGTIERNKRVYMLSMTALQNNLKVTLLDILTFLELMPSSAFMNSLNQADEKSSHYKSAHTYNLELFSLSEKMITGKFNDVWPLPAAPAVISHPEP